MAMASDGLDEDDMVSLQQGHAQAPSGSHEDEEAQECLRSHFPLSFGPRQAQQQQPRQQHRQAQQQPGGRDSASVLEEPRRRVHGPLPMPPGSKAQHQQRNSETPVATQVPAPEVEEDKEYPSDDRDGLMVGPPLPPASAPLVESDTEEIGPPRPPPPNAGSSTDDDDADTDDDEDDDGDGARYEEEDFKVPLSNEIVLKGHSKVVSALAVDPTGTRVLTGSYDYMVRMYDFQGMDSRLQSFRQLEPFEGHQVRGLSWSPTADRFLCVTGSAQAKIYDRDGLTLGEFLRGDMYIRDLKNTKGHISGLTGGQWHPKEKQTILTCSEDGSLRIWDVSDFKSQKQVIKPKLARPGRVPVTACAWGLEGKCVAGGLGNGSVQVWNIKGGWGSRPDVYIEKAHKDGEDVSGLTFSSDGYTLLSRSLDETLKVWDLRAAKSPVKIFGDLPNFYPQTNVAFSPNEQLIMTGTSAEKDGKAGGLLYLFDRRRLELLRKIGVSSQSVVSCMWHTHLNQILATTGDKKEGSTHIFYDPVISVRGALVCVSRAPRKKSMEDFEARPVIHHPHALPLFRDEPSRKRQREKARSDPLKSMRPDLPVTGPGHGGRVGTTKGSLLTQYLLKEGGLMKETWMEEDPRAAILRHAEAAASDPKYIAPAYAKTQPDTIFASDLDSDEEET